MSLPSRGRGLKYLISNRTGVCCHVAPLAGAWIEISLLISVDTAVEVAPLAGAWIEIRKKAYADLAVKRRSPRGGVD